MTIEEKMRALWDLQKIDSQLTKIRILKGELPEEVRDLEDEIQGLVTRRQKLENDVKELEGNEKTFQLIIKEAEN